jgi:mannose-1-phosphate guanylyltransferase
VRLVDKLVFGRYCVDKTGAAIDVRAAALDWLITDARQESAWHGLEMDIQALSPTEEQSAL